MGRVGESASELEAVAVKEGWEVIERFVDRGISGAKGREGRPAFDSCAKDCTPEFDVVAAWSVDRLGRSLQDLVAFPPRTSQQAREPVFPQAGIDTTTQEASYFSRC